jgi:sensor histidine kinase YesM
MESKTTLLFWKFLEPRFWWLRHIVYLLYSFFDYIIDGLGIVNFYDDNTRLWTTYIIPNFIVMYISWGLIAPLLIKRKIFLALGGTLLTYSIFSILSFYFNPTDRFGEPIPVWVEFIQGFDDAVRFGLPMIFLRSVVHFIHEFKREEGIKREQLSTELAYLKNQINPHFLFNTLNNIAVLADLFPERVTPTIVELSNVLRYQLYESEKSRVLLFNEVENLRQNLNLEAMRLNEVEANINVEGDITGVEVAPLLFLPFLENALKHSVNPSGLATISAYFTMETDKKLYFNIKNSKPPVKPIHIAGGLGLKNIQRRLELLYPNKHELTIVDSKEWYEVTLRLESPT